MRTVRAIGVRNLRALRDTGLIEIKPLTILVGKNSAGKSSFARVLPLLKQSAERRKQAPLLWFGRLVDFGSFGEALSSYADEPEIELRIRFAAPQALYVSRRAYRPQSDDNDANIDVTIRLASEGAEERTVLRELLLDVFGVQVRVAFSSGREVLVHVDGVPAHVGSDARAVYFLGAVLPIIRRVPRESASATVSDASLFQPARPVGLGAHEVRAAITAFVHGNTLGESKDEIASRLPLASPGDLLRHCMALGSAPDTWRQSMNALASRNADQELKPLQRALVLFHLESLLVELDESLQMFCAGISYLEPLRATAQRYYRREEISIDEIDPKGINTTFFIQGLSNRDRDALNEWLSSTFGFSLTVTTTGGHSSLNIQVASGNSRNMADVGLGYSQIAPVAVQLWLATRETVRPAPRFRSGRREAKTVVIEQPELHLHPAYQAKLADVFASCVSQVGVDPRSPRVSVLAETHSPNLIGRLGELVSSGQLSANDVQVLVFEQEESQATAAEISVATFDSEGILRNWPIGFFDY